MIPDWSGRTVVIAASGPSFRKEQVEAARGMAEVIAINETWRAAPWAAALYGCDWQWWGRCAPKPEDFKGLRVMGVEAPKRSIRPEMVANLATVDMVAYATAGVWQMQFGGKGVGAGGSSAYQAANLAVKWGAKRLLLLGVDCRKPNDHWHIAHSFLEAHAQDERLMKRWIEAWNSASRQLKRMGVEVINCSPGSAVGCFPRGDIRDILT